MAIAKIEAAENGSNIPALNDSAVAREPPIHFPLSTSSAGSRHYLDEQTAKIDALIAETERFIELARERRSALITAAVTGQIDVREVALMAEHNEIAFETEICEHLAAHGWLYSPNDTGYDRERALFPEDLFGWLEETQPEQLAKVVKPGCGDEAKQQASCSTGS